MAQDKEKNGDCMDGYQPTNEGYQPLIPDSESPSDDKVDNGYQPEKGSGDEPSPPRDD